MNKLRRQLTALALGLLLTLSGWAAQAALYYHYGIQKIALP